MEEEDDHAVSGGDDGEDNEENMDEDDNEDDGDDDGDDLFNLCAAGRKRSRTTSHGSSSTKRMRMETVRNKMILDYPHLSIIPHFILLYHNYQVALLISGVNING